MKIIIISILVACILLISCCPEAVRKSSIRTDSVYIEKIIRDTIIMDSSPAIIITIDSSKSFTVNPFEAVIDSIIRHAGKDTRVKVKFRMLNRDSSSFNLKIEDITGNISRTMSKIKTVIISDVVQENTAWHQIILWISFGFVLGLIFMIILKFVL